MMPIKHRKKTSGNFNQNDTPPSPLKKAFDRNKTEKSTPPVEVVGLSRKMPISQNQAEEEFESARGESQFESALEYDYLSGIMDSKGDIDQFSSPMNQPSPMPQKPTEKDTDRLSNAFRKSTTSTPNVINMHQEAPQMSQQKNSGMTQNQKSLFNQTTSSSIVQPIKSVASQQPSQIKPKVQPQIQMLSLNPLIEVLIESYVGVPLWKCVHSVPSHE